MSAPVTRIAINGFGRIGRSLLRLILSQGRGGPFEVVLVNDVAPLETLSYLFKYDSVFGPYPGEVTIQGNAMVVDGVALPFCTAPDISGLDLSGVDLVLECTGKASTRSAAEAGLRAGAGGVLISGPSAAADLTVVLGANEAALDGQAVVSNASCTTNALAPILKVLDAAFGIESGQMTTVHCYTGSQPSVDMPNGGPARSRAAALSMVPTTTSAAELIGQVLPALSGRIEARALRVPVASVSCIDLTIACGDAPDAQAVNDILYAATGPIIGWCEDPVVSTDMRARPQSIVVAPRETSVSASGLIRVFGWYDNEWGFSNRMLDVAQLMAERRGGDALP